MYPSPFADGGYDIADFTACRPPLGQRRRRGRRWRRRRTPGACACCSTSSPTTPRSRTRGSGSTPDRYVWADAPANNWRAAFGGPAWSRDAATGRAYLHSFYPEQPDLDWRNPAVRGRDAGGGAHLARHAASTASASTPSIASASTPTCSTSRPRRVPPAFPRDARLGRARAPPTRATTARARPGARRPAGGRRRRVPGRRGLPAHAGPSPVPGPPLERLRVRAPARAVAGRRRRRRRSARGALLASTPLDALKPRLQPGRIAHRRAQPARGGDAPADAPRARSSCTRATRSGCSTGPTATRPTTATAATAPATRCSGTPAQTAGSRPRRRGWRRSTRPVRNVADQRADPGSLYSLHRRLIELRRGLRGGLDLVAARPDGLLAYRRGRRPGRAQPGSGAGRGRRPHLPNSTIREWMPIGRGAARHPRRRRRGGARAGRRCDLPHGLSTLSGMPWDTGLNQADVENDFLRARRRQVLARWPSGCGASPTTST